MLLQTASGLVLITLLAQFPPGMSLLPSDNTTIPFHITQQSNSHVPRTLDGRDWRHNFDLVLTRSTETISIFDEFGSRHDFDIESLTSSSYFSSSGNRSDSGIIQRHGDTISWLRPSGTRIVFHGSLPIRIETENDQSLMLDYSIGRLTSVHGTDNDLLQFNYTNGILTQVEFQDLADAPDYLERFSCEQSVADSSTSTPESTRDCDRTENPPPEDTSTPSFSGAIAVDLRPATCNSYFIEFFGTTRGQEIEYALETHSRYQRYSPTVRSFPVIDLIAEDELLIVRSRDLTSASYDSLDFPEGLYRRLLQDAADIQDMFVNPLQHDGFLQTTELGETTRVERDILSRPMVLEVIIRHGFATPAHIAQINQARTIIEQTYGIELRVVEIP